MGRKGSLGVDPAYQSLRKKGQIWGAWTMQIGGVMKEHFSRSLIEAKTDGIILIQSPSEAR